MLAHQPQGIVAEVGLRIGLYGKGSQPGAHVGYTGANRPVACCHCHTHHAISCIIPGDGKGHGLSLLRHTYRNSALAQAWIERITQPITHQNDPERSQADSNTWEGR